MESRQLDDARRQIEQFFDPTMHDVRLQADLARLMYATGHRMRSLEMYSEIEFSHPGNAYPVTQRAILLLNESFPFRNTRPGVRPGRATLQMSTLGHNGRFGNQINQYAFLRICARSQGLSLQTPNWVGRYLFDLRDDPINEPRPVVRETEIDGPAALSGISPAAGKVGRLNEVDVWGYFTLAGVVLRAYKSEFQHIFQPAPWIRSFTDDIIKGLENRSRTVIAVHVRRGDMVTNPDFWVAPVDWYLTHLTRIWEESDKPILYVATDEPSVKHAFKRFGALVDRDVSDPIPGAEFFTDWFVLSRAHHLCISNSTFSFTASMMNMTCVDFFRPSRARGALVRYDPWMAEQLIEL